MAKRLHLSFAFATLTLTAAGCPANALPTEPELQAVDAIIADAIADRELPGAALAISVNGKLTASRVFGVSDIATNAPVSRATLFRLGSISKFLTAAAVMHLVQRGKLRLTDKVAVLLTGRPELAGHLGTVTVEQLLNHTSGLPDLTSSDLGELVTRNSTVSDKDVAGALQRPAPNPPGIAWSYNNVGYRLLSWVVEDSTGRRFNDYVVGELAPALRLKSLQPCDLAQSNLSRGYIAAEGKLVPDPSYSVRGLLGDGGLCATVEDLVMLPGRLLGQDWIKARTVAAMTRPTTLPDGTLVDYGLGVRRGIIGSLPMWGHTGSGLAGGWAAVAHYPSRRMTIAVAGNGSGGARDAITLQAKIAAALLKQDRLRNDTVGKSLGAMLPMAFEADGTRVCFTRIDSGVARRTAGSSAPPRPLLYQGAGSFARSDYPLDRYVIQLVAGRPIAHRVYYDGFFAELLKPVPPAGC